MEQIITPSQVASLLQIHVRTVYRLVQEGVIPGNRIGRGWRFNKKDILDLVSNKQREKLGGGRPRGQRKERPPSI